MTTIELMMILVFVIGAGGVVALIYDRFFCASSKQYRKLDKRLDVEISKL